MEAEGLWNTYTYAAVAIIGLKLVLYFFYTYVVIE